MLYVEDVVEKHIILIKDIVHIVDSGEVVKLGLMHGRINLKENGRRTKRS
jgi:hypothetical protein